MLARNPSGGINMVGDWSFLLVPTLLFSIEFDFFSFSKSALSRFLLMISC